MLFILGIIAVIMIILGGIRYTTSAGDASRVKAAKDTIMYSIVGLVVAMLAFAIVNFVIGRV
jgi:glucose uptake protein GlcU